MNKIFFLVFFIFAFNCECKNLKSLEEQINESKFETNDKKNWAVLVAGSNGYFNYRHQADVLHAYQILNKKHGIPKEQIVLMMYDDIAYNDYNPYKGNIINYPGGENLYTDDIEKDFTGEDVSSKNFLKVLLGDEELKKSGKKVLQSNENDHVFVYFSDHGSEGVVCFPGEYLFADDLIKTLKEMKEKKMYSKLLFYLEACESGSMFKDLLDDNLDIYAVTAANESESSYAVYLDEKRDTYLADEFSINWMTDSEKNDKEKTNQLLNKQYENVKIMTKGSHVCQFGDLSMGSQYHVSDFIGKPISISNEEQNNLVYLQTSHQNKIDSRDVEYHLTRLHSQKKNDNKFNALYKNREIASSLINQLVAKFSEILNANYYSLTQKSQIKNVDCYKQLVDSFNNHCANISKHTYFLRHLHIFANACNNIKMNEQENIITADETELENEVKKHCKVFKKSFTKISKIV